MTKLQTKIMLLAAMAAVVLMPAARADQWNQKTVFTFGGPIEVPGQILPAGTYVFKLANTADRHIVQVFNQTETEIFGTFLAVPDYRMKPCDKTIINFDERAAGAPQAIKAWFYPGRNYGHEFVYPKNKAVALAKENHTPVPSMPTELAVDTTVHDTSLDSPEIAALAGAHLMAEEPNGEEVEVAEAFSVTDTQASASHAELPDSLPSTATPLPLVGMMGFLSLGAAAALRLAAVKAK